MNELKVVSDAMAINVWEVIEAAKTKPFGYVPFYPGPGLGGHCVPINPFCLTWKAREHGITTRFIELAGEINTAMPGYVVERLVRALDERAAKGLNGACILIVGSSIALEPEAIAAFDAVLIVTDHDGIDYEALVAAARLDVDTRNATRDVRTHREKIVLA